MQNGNKRNSKTKGELIWIMLQSFLIGRMPTAMATVLKIRFQNFVIYSYIIFPSMVNMQDFVFELLFLQC